MRLVHTLALIFLLFFCVTHCDKGNPADPGSESDKFIWVHFQGDSTRVMFDDLPKIDADGESAIQLSAFIDTTIIPIYRDKNGVAHETRRLYAYQITGDDGFSASVKGYPNNSWEHLTLGHVLTETRLVVFPDDKIDIAGAYNVKNARHIYIHRKFDISSPDTTAFIELRTVTPTSVTNPEGTVEDGLLLMDLVSGYITAPENYRYEIIALDGYTPPTDLDWNQFQTGYWLLDSKKTMFSDSTVAIGKYQIRVLEKILVK
ncbi:MAG: hypothetical protein SCK70_15235 [bacterium]|nr:hypothetical protein [bacterium]